MQSDAVQVENKPLECRFILLGALSSLRRKYGKQAHPMGCACFFLSWPFLALRHMMQPNCQLNVQAKEYNPWSSTCHVVDFWD